MFESKPKHSYLDLFEGIIIGGSLAAAATFLFATKKGKEVQKKLVHQYHKLGHITKKMRDKVEKVIHKHVPKKMKSAIKKKVKKIVKKAKKSVHRKAA